MQNPENRSITILMVDDDPADVRLTREALGARQMASRIYDVCDGIEALAFLQKQGVYADAPRPDLILMDLNMPRMDGRETLAAIKNDLSFRRIPVIVLTTSADEADVAKAYELNANCYITKPVDWSRFIRVIRLIEDFWLTIVCLPR